MIRHLTNAKSSTIRTFMYSTTAMARSDLLLKLVKSGSTGNQPLFRKVVQSIIAEERTKQHHILAKQLQDILENEEQINGNRNTFPEKHTSQSLNKFVYDYQPQISLNSLYFSTSITETIGEILEEHYRSDLLRSYNLEPRHRIILKGEPGTGKTSPR